MQLDGAAPALFPLLIEVQKQVYATMQQSSFIDIEIDVDVELLPILIVVCSSSKESFVRDKIRDAGQLPDYGQERDGIYVLVKPVVEGAYCGYPLHDCFSTRATMLIGRLPFVERREIAKKCSTLVELQET